MRQNRRTTPPGSSRPWFALLAAAVAAATALTLTPGCATGRKLPPFERPLPRTEFQHVRTTAYTHTESDHKQYGALTAAGTRLKYGPITSAAADWSRWPLGTRFRVLESGKVYEVDDYGWMLAGTNTIDLYHPSRPAMNHWGTRYVTIQILHWGDMKKSRAILMPRRKHKHVRRMLDQM